MGESSESLDEFHASMIRSPNAVRARNHTTIGAILHQDAGLIVEEWAERARDQEHGRPGAHRNELRDHLPEFLLALGRVLSGSEPGDEPNSSRGQAVEHGRFRWQSGWELQDVVVDYQLLRLVVLQHLTATLQREPNLDEVLALGVHFDDAISEAVVAYVEHQAGQLQQAHRRLNEFLGVLGHELRNPLGTIAVALQLARMSRPIPEDLSEAIDSISRSVGTMTRLMDDMLDVARVTRGDLEIRTSHVSLADLVRTAVDSARPIVDERGHRLDLTLSREPLVVVGDPTRLEQVLVNLVTNAAKYTEPGGRIEVTAESEAGLAVVRVRDNGAGIDPAFLPHLFDLFAQAPEHNGRGLGIGLALVRSLVEGHGGTITAQSDGPGRGSTFCVRLPLVESALPGLDAEADASADAEVDGLPGPGRPGRPAEPRRILIVDDERDAARLLAMVLEQEGHEVRVAFDGTSALAQAQAMVPDLILMDLGLPDLAGDEVARRLREQPRLQPTLIVALTGFSPGQAPSPDDPSFNLFLTKPVDADTLRQILSTHPRSPSRPPSPPVD